MKNNQPPIWKVLACVAVGLFFCSHLCAQIIFAPPINYNGQGSTAIMAADVNGDQKVDLISANGNIPGTLSVWTNDGSGGFVLASSPGVRAHRLLASRARSQNSGCRWQARPISN